MSRVSAHAMPQGTVGQITGRRAHGGDFKQVSGGQINTVLDFSGLRLGSAQRI